MYPNLVNMDIIFFLRVPNITMTSSWLMSNQQCQSYTTMSVTWLGHAVHSRGVLAGSLFIHPDRSFPVDKPTELPNKPTAVIQPKSTHQKNPSISNWAQWTLNSLFTKAKMFPLRCQNLFSGWLIIDDIKRQHSRSRGEGMLPGFSFCNGCSRAISTRLVSAADPAAAFGFQHITGPFLFQTEPTWHIYNCILPY